MDGLITVDASQLKDVVASYELLGWRVFRLPPGISSRDEFFDAVRGILPLDPALSSNRSWEALSDSVWGGLDAQKEDKLLLVWPDAFQMAANAPEDFKIAKAILEDLPSSLSDPDVTAGPTKQLRIVMS